MSFSTIPTLKTLNIDKTKCAICKDTPRSVLDVLCKDCRHALQEDCEHYETVKADMCDLECVSCGLIFGRY